MLILDSIFKSYIHTGTPITILKEVSYRFSPGSTYAITGVSGSGKSTLIHLLAGLDTPTAGRIFFNEKEFACFTPQEKSHFLNTAVGVVFQQPYLIKELTVIENVTIKMRIAGATKLECLDAGMSLLADIDLVKFADYYPGQLSGGQQQRVALVRALCNKPKFLLADEPTGSLDAENAQRLLELMLGFVTPQTGLIISSHDPLVTGRMDFQLRIVEGQLRNS